MDLSSDYSYVHVFQFSNSLVEEFLGVFIQANQQSTKTQGVRFTVSFTQARQQSTENTNLITKVIQPKRNEKMKRTSQLSHDIKLFNMLQYC